MILTTGYDDFNILFDNRAGIGVDETGGTSILIQGGAGLGKTTLALQLSAEACIRDPVCFCLYYTFEQSANQLIKIIKAFKWEVQADVNAWDVQNPWERHMQLVIIDAYKTSQQPVDILTEKIEDHISRLRNSPSTSNASTIVVLDSIGAINELMKGERTHIAQLIRKMRTLRSTLMLVKENPDREYLSQTEYLVDIIIDLQEKPTFSGISSNDLDNYLLRSYMQIIKTRSGRSYRGPHEFEIRNDPINKRTGFIVYPSLRSIAEVSEKEKGGEEKEGVNEPRANFGIEIIDRELEVEDNKTEENMGMKYGTSLLLKADPGSYKTELGMKFLLEGFRKKEKGLFISCRIAKQALFGLTIYDDDEEKKRFLNEQLSFIEASHPYRTPANIMASIRQEIEKSESNGKEWRIRRAIIFGIGMLDTLTAFRSESLQFLQVLITYFKNKKISGVFIDWPTKITEIRQIEAPTELAGNFIAGAIDISSETFQENDETRKVKSLILKRKEHRYVDKKIGYIKLTKGSIIVEEPPARLDTPIPPSEGVSPIKQA